MSEPQAPYVTFRGENGRIAVERDQFGGLKIWMMLKDESKWLRVDFRSSDAVTLAKGIFGLAGLREEKKKAK